MTQTTRQPLYHEEKARVQGAHKRAGALAGHAGAVFYPLLFGSEWEQRKVDKYLR